MRHVRAGLLRLAGLFHKRSKDQDLADELDSHFQMHVEENLRSGLAPAEARRQALLKLGGMEQAKESYRDRRSVPIIETTLQDLRYSVRTLRKNAGFTAVAVSTLALGVAVNTTIFSMVSAMLLRKPPVAEPDRVMIVSSINKLEPRWNSNVSVPDYLSWREQSRLLDLSAAMNRDVTLLGGSEPQRVPAMAVTSGYFRVLNVQAVLGRTFALDEDRHMIILSHKLWQSRFHSDPGIIGSAVPVDGERYTVIGVMPARFRLNTFDASVWIPLVFTPQQLSPASRADRVLSVAARLKNGVSSGQAQAEMTAITQRLEASHPETNKNRSARVLSLQEFMIQDASVRAALEVLMGAVVFVLLIACTNVANLLLARNSARQRELVIRAAVGAGRLRLIRQLLVESLLIGAAGGGLGFLLAIWGTALLRSLLSWNDFVQIMASEMVLDLPVLGFCLIISILAAIFFGLLPALEASKFDLNAVLNESARGGSGGVSRRRLRSALVIGEIALSIILLTGAGVNIQAVMVGMRQALGFNPRNVITAEVRVAGSRYAEPRDQAAFFDNLERSARELPGVKCVAVTSALPFTGSVGRSTFVMEGQAGLPKDLELSARHYIAGSDYFRTLGIPLIAGRVLAGGDTENGRAVAVINETFAHRFFPKQDPVGRRIRIDRGPSGKSSWSEIVGVVGDVRDYPGQPAFDPQMYESFLQRPQTVMTFLVQTKSDPGTIAPLLRRAIWSVDKDQPVGTIHTMVQVAKDASAGDIFMAWLMGVFASLALLLAAVGIFGVIAYNVAQRTRELGIRMALGAEKRDVLRLVVGQSAILTGLGVGFGLLGAMPLPSILGSMFHGLPASPTPVLVSMPLLVALVSLAASYVPARRAMRVEPVIALRYE